MLHGLKQHTLVVLKFWRAESQLSLGDYNRTSVGLVPLEGSRGHSHSLAHSLSLYPTFEATELVFPSSGTSYLLLIKTLVSTQIFHGDLSITRSLIDHIYKGPFARKGDLQITPSQISRIERQVFLMDYMPPPPSPRTIHRLKF